MKIKDLLHNKKLADKHILFLIIKKILGYEKEKVYLNFDKEINSEDGKKIIEIYEKYQTENIPIEYLLNEVKFMDEIFFVNENTLIPRPETEYLIKYVLDLDRFKDGINIENNTYTKELSNKSPKSPYFHIYDIGTGSGIIAIMLAKLLPNSVVASDISEKALEVARKNAKSILKNKSNIAFLKSNLGEHIKDDNFILCANLPYLEESYKLDVFTSYEPDLALFAGKDGLDLYRKLINQLQGKTYTAFFELTEKQAHILNSDFGLNVEILETCHLNIKILKFERK